MPQFWFGKTFLKTLFKELIKAYKRINLRVGPQYSPPPDQSCGPDLHEMAVALRALERSGIDQNSEPAVAVTTGMAESTGLAVKTGNKIRSKKTRGY